MPHHAIVGRVTEEIQPGRLIISHISLSGPALDAAIEDVKKSYTGPLTIGADLQCTPVKQ